MLSKEHLKSLLHQGEFTRQDTIIICMAAGNAGPKSIKDIKEIAIESGIREINRWNISYLISNAKFYIFRTKAGFELTMEGEKRARQIANIPIETPAIIASATLRQHLSKINDPQISSFVDEAIGCCEKKFYRAAVVLSWVGAVSILYNHVVKNCFSAFNTEAKRRHSDWKNAKDADGLARMKEDEFLDILEVISVIDSNVKKLLKPQLNLRNTCGHPNTIVITENMVAAHLDVLILNVYSKYQV